VQQYAKSLFLDREIFATPKRTGILLLVSLYERRVVILPDKGLDERLPAEDVKKIIGVMTPLLKRQQISQAFEAGLDYLSRILTTVCQESSNNEFPNAVIEDEGI
jgi:putative membrane protein